MAPLRAAADRFCPPYEVAEEDRRGLRVILKDPAGDRPPLTLRHRAERRLFFRANYLAAEADVPGAGPPEDGELVFRFRGPLSRQRSSVRWRQPPPHGEQWRARLSDSLVEAAGKVEAVQSLSIGWDAAASAWRLRLTTMSGSMVGGFLAPLPIAVPFDAAEAEGIIGMVDALAATRV